MGPQDGSTKPPTVDAEEVGAAGWVGHGGCSPRTGCMQGGDENGFPAAAIGGIAAAAGVVLAVAALMRWRRRQHAIGTASASGRGDGYGAVECDAAIVLGQGAPATPRHPVLDELRGSSATPTGEVTPAMGRAAAAWYASPHDAEQPVYASPGGSSLGIPASRLGGAIITASKIRPGYLAREMRSAAEHDRQKVTQPPGPLRESAPANSPRDPLQASLIAQERQRSAEAATEAPPAPPPRHSLALDAVYSTVEPPAPNEYGNFDGDHMLEDVHL